MAKQADSGGQKSSTKYIDTLDSISRRRYANKLTAVMDVDPYENSTWSTDVQVLPKIEQDDISEYLVHRVSFYTRDKFKAEKSLGAHNQLTSGWVKNISSFKPQGCENIIIRAEVFHSQSLSEKPLKPWVISQEDGTIVAGHCDCMAGLAESCSHVAALLFTVDATVRLRDSKTPTQIPAGWVMPSNKAVMYQEASEIQFTSSATKKRELDCSIEGRPSDVKSKRKRCEVPPPNPAELSGLFDNIQSSKTGVKPAILSLIPGYSDEYVPSVNNVPCFLGDLYDDVMATKDYAEVLIYCATVKDKISVTPEQAENAELLSRDQARCKFWGRLRTGRVTASVAHQVCHTNPAKPSLSLIQQICNPSKKVQTAAMKWGLDHEKDALKCYAAAMEQTHQDFRVERCGAFINPLSPHLAASPDGLSFCSCHGRGIIEIKCPASKAKCSIEECMQTAKFYLEKNGSGVRLKRNHPYYTQVQTQLLVTEAAFCDFIVWTTKDFSVERINPDTDLIRDISPKMEKFFSTAILPELVGHCFSRPRPQPLQESPTKNVQNTTAELFCTCRRTEEEDDMVACDNKKCPILWFHFFCVSIKTAPKGKWYCATCREQSPFKHEWNSMAKKRPRKTLPLVL